MTAPLFLSAEADAVERLRGLAGGVLDAIGGWAAGSGPRSDIGREALATLVAGIDPCPAVGVEDDAVLATVLAHGVRTFDPHCVAHLHSPTLLASAAAELAIGASNQSMDSYDQAPAATLVEDHLVRWLAGVVGFPPGATGVLTAGGTASNLLALLLARDHAGASSVAADGLPPEAARWRIVASAAAHFSVQRAAAVLGLGHRAVVAVPTEPDGRIDVAALDRTLAVLDDRVIAVVGTAGTTDTGAIDPLDALADRAAALGAWFHVDAAVGGGFCISERLRGLVAGIERADSVTTDLHKLWWQPIGASVLLVRDPESLATLRHPSDYLDRPEDDELNLVSRSLDTSRRFDALKILVGLRSTGRRQLAAMLEHLVDLTTAAAELIDAHPELELLVPPSTVTVLFRCRGGDDANIRIQRALFDSGRAIIGRTRHDGRVALKLTLVNSQISRADLASLLDLIVSETELVP